MSLFNKIKSIFHSEGESQATEKTNDFNPTDDLMLDTFNLNFRLICSDNASCKANCL